MPAFKDLTGLSISNFTVMSRAADQGNRVTWLCRCICGSDHLVESRNLLGGSVQSCGCLSNALRSSNNPNNNGNTSNYAYRPWCMMKNRCNNPNYTHYQYYGGLGITVCPTWQDSFQSFLHDMGPRPVGYTLDRIDGEGDYTPENCRWASKAEQVYNREYTRLFDIYGTLMNLREIANMFDLEFISLTNAINRGWDLWIYISIKQETRVTDYQVNGLDFS